MFLKTHIAMDDAERLAIRPGLGMRVGQTPGDATGDEHRQFERQLAALVAELVGELFEVHAADEFHGDKEDAIGFAQLVGLDDVGVDQIRDQLGFADKIINEGFLARVIGADNLDGDPLDKVAGAALLGFVHDAHPALEDFTNDVVTEIVLDAE